MTFGAGIHYCLGSGLARAELEEAMAILVRNAASIQLEEAAQWMPFHHIRCFQPPVWARLER
jgi:cytochrome P450